MEAKEILLIMFIITLSFNLIVLLSAIIKLSILNKKSKKR